MNRRILATATAGLVLLHACVEDTCPDAGACQAASIDLGG